MPAGLDFERAAALTITYGTAYYGLRYRAMLRPQETLAVLGASGGVGLAAVELGREMGARVIACASSDDKLAFARAHGAHEVVNYERDDLREALKGIGGEHGVDVVFDPVGGRYSEPALRCSPGEGRHPWSASPPARSRTLLNLVLLKAARAWWFWGRGRLDKDDYKVAIAMLADWRARCSPPHPEDLFPRRDAEALGASPSAR